VAVGKLPALKVYGDNYDTRDGTGERDYLHVVDLARAHVAALGALDQDAAGHQVINIGTGQGVSVLEMVAAFKAATGQTLPVRHAPRRAGDLPSFYADAGRANARLGWKATLGLADMCRDSWNWQSLNPDGYANVASGSGQI
jgi:UDP-glucose 4-epimerase